MKAKQRTAESKNHGDLSFALKDPCIDTYEFIISNPYVSGAGRGVKVILKYFEQPIPSNAYCDIKRIH